MLEDYKCKLKAVYDPFRWLILIMHSWVPIWEIVAYIVLMVRPKQFNTKYEGSCKMAKIDIGNIIVFNVDTKEFKSMTGTITLQSLQNDKAKAKYSLDHMCFSYSLQLLGSPVIVTFDDSRKLIVGVRPVTAPKKAKTTNGKPKKGEVTKQ